MEGEFKNIDDKYNRATGMAPALAGMNGINKIRTDSVLSIYDCRACQKILIATETAVSGIMANNGNYIGEGEVAGF